MFDTALPFCMFKCEHSHYYAYIRLQFINFLDLLWVSKYTHLKLQVYSCGSQSEKVLLT